jgi:hypothetical protein
VRQANVRRPGDAATTRYCSQLDAELETVDHAADCADRLSKGACAGAGHRCVLARPPARHRQRIRDLESDIAFVGESAKRGMDGANRSASFRAPLHLGLNRHCVGVIAEPSNGDEDEHLEFAEVSAFGHVEIIYKGEHIGKRQFSDRCETLCDGAERAAGAGRGSGLLSELWRKDKRPLTGGRSE